MSARRKLLPELRRYSGAMKRLLISGIASAVLIGTAAQVAVPRYAREYQSSCWSASFVFPRAVHTNGWNRPDVLGAELNGYTAIHWQVTQPASGLRHVPKPDQCGYQVVLTLEPAHAKRLAADIAAAQAQHQKRFSSAKARLALARRAQAEARYPGRSLPWHARPTISPDLKQYVPAEGRWMNWGDCCPYDGHRGRNLYVHADSAVAVVNFPASD